MAIDEEDLKEIIEPKSKIEEISTISSDGRNLLTRIPKNVVEKALLKKGQELRWRVEDDTRKLELEVVKKNDIQKEKGN